MVAHADTENGTKESPGRGSCQRQDSGDAALSWLQVVEQSRGWSLLRAQRSASLQPFSDGCGSAQNRLSCSGIDFRFRHWFPILSQCVRVAVSPPWKVGLLVGRILWVCPSWGPRRWPNLSLFLTLVSDGLPPTSWGATTPRECTPTPRGRSLDRAGISTAGHFEELEARAWLTRCSGQTRWHLLSGRPPQLLPAGQRND